jgi:multimeric flavodoxin WrbA
MKVFAIMGSPRKGNSYKITQLLEAKLKNCGAVDFEYLFLKDSHLETCRGCYNCILKGENFCPLQDDRLKIEEKMLSADGVIFVSPNYACGVTSLMKNFIDRFAFIGHRPRFFNQYALAIATSGGPVGLKQTLYSLSYFAGGGFNFIKKIGIMTPPFPLPVKDAMKTERQITITAQQFYLAMKEKRRPSPTWSQIIQFRAFKGIYQSNERIGKEIFPADYQYWTDKGWLNPKTDYYISPRLNVFKKMFGRCFEKIIRVYAKKMLSNNEPAG